MTAGTRRVEHRDASLRCTHCGETITAETPTEARSRYTDHVTREHGLPAVTRDSRRRRTRKRSRGD